MWHLCPDASKVRVLKFFSNWNRFFKVPLFTVFSFTIHFILFCFFKTETITLIAVTFKISLSTYSFSISIWHNYFFSPIRCNYYKIQVTSLLLYKNESCLKWPTRNRQTKSNLIYRKLLSLLYVIISLLHFTFYLECSLDLTLQPSCWPNILNHCRS